MMSRETTFVPPRKSLTSLSRDQLIHVVRAHEEKRASIPRNTPPRALKKAKHVDQEDTEEEDEDDLEGFLAKAKASLGVAIKCENNDLSSPLRVKDDDKIPSRQNWLKCPSRSFRSFASSCGGSTAAELDCLASIATPPGLLRNATNSSFSRPGNPQLAMMEEEYDDNDDDDDDNFPIDYDPVTKQFSC